MKVAIYAVPIALALYALIDWFRNPAPVVAGVKRGLWLLIILIPVFGPLAWLLANWLGGGTAAAPPPRGPLAPDDDPDFLWRLEQQRRAEQRKREQAKASDSTGADVASADSGTEETDSHAGESESHSGEGDGPPPAVPPAH